MPFAPPIPIASYFENNIGIGRSPKFALCVSGQGGGAVCSDTDAVLREEVDGVMYFKFGPTLEIAAMFTHGGKTNYWRFVS